MFFKVSIDHSVDKPESGKRNKYYCCGKSLQKVLNSGSKNLYEPCPYLFLLIYNGHYFVRKLNITFILM